MSAKTMAERKAVLIRLDPKVHAALRRWAEDDLRSFNAQVQFLLRKSLREAGRHTAPAGDEDDAED